MKIGFFSDPHITLDSIDELENTFNWILEYFKSKKLNTIVMLGDYFTKKTPNIKAFIFGTKWARKFKDNFEKVIFLNGNHDNKEQTSNLEYLKYLDIEVVDEYVFEKEKIYCGHFFVKESPINYGKDYKSLKSIGKFKYIILGHYHDFSELDKNAWHLGSCRYVSFGETKEKYVAVFDGKIFSFEKIPTVIPAITVHTVKELKKINKNTKVRIVFDNLQEYKKFLAEAKKYHKKFIKFKAEVNFEDNNIDFNSSNDINDNKEFVLKWLNEQEKDVKKTLEPLFKEKGLL